MSTAVLSRFRWVHGHADVWRLFSDADTFSTVVRALADPWRAEAVTRVCGVEARGFLLGGAVGYELGVGFVAIRKAAGLFPGPKHAVTANADYRGVQHTLRLQRSSLDVGDRVVLVDDWVETGSQVSAAQTLVDAAGAQLVGISVVVDQLPDDLRASLPRVHAIVAAADLPSSRRQGDA